MPGGNIGIGERGETRYYTMPPPIPTRYPESHFCPRCGAWTHDGESALAPFCFNDLLPREDLDET